MKMKHKAFVMKYLECYNATKAYQDIYNCSYETARVNGSQLLRKKEIDEFIKSKEIEIQEASVLNVKQLKEQLSTIIIDKKMRTDYRLKAIDTLAKIHGAYNHIQQTENTHIISNELEKLSDDELQALIDEVDDET